MFTSDKETKMKETYEESDCGSFFFFKEKSCEDVNKVHCRLPLILMKLGPFTRIKLRFNPRHADKPLASEVFTFIIVFNNHFSYSFAGLDETFGETKSNLDFVFC